MRTRTKVKITPRFIRNARRDEIKMRYLLKVYRKKELGERGQIKFGKLYHKHIHRFGLPLPNQQTTPSTEDTAKLKAIIKEAIETVKNVIGKELNYKEIV